MIEILLFLLNLFDLGQCVGQLLCVLSIVCFLYCVSMFAAAQNAHLGQIMNLNWNLNLIGMFDM